MDRTVRLGILSDIHYAGAAERARGNDYELRVVPNWALRRCVYLYRRFFWMHRPLRQNYLLDRFLEQSRHFDYIVANGDFSCDTGFVGVSDQAVFESVRECLNKLREKFGNRLLVTFGDHELGKCSIFGRHGGMRLASWYRAQKDLGLRPFWQMSLGNCVLMGVVSSLIALPVFEADTLPEERASWQRLRVEHLLEICAGFDKLASHQRVLLFCHDPTALPFLWREPVIHSRLNQIEQTVIGHLHSNLILWKSRLLAGIPRIRFLGHTAKRLSAALQEARYWRPFQVRLCPALAGIELLKDGGYLTAELDPLGAQPVHFQKHGLKRERQEEWSSKPRP
jgi:hypothetical protein